MLTQHPTAALGPEGGLREVQLGAKVEGIVLPDGSEACSVFRFPDEVCFVVVVVLSAPESVSCDQLPVVIQRVGCFGEAVEGT